MRLPRTRFTRLPYEIAAHYSDRGPNFDWALTKSETAISRRDPDYMDADEYVEKSVKRKVYNWAHEKHESAKAVYEDLLRQFADIISENHGKVGFDMPSAIVDLVEEFADVDAEAAKSMFDAFNSAEVVQELRQERMRRSRLARCAQIACTGPLNQDPSTRSDLENRQLKELNYQRRKLEDLRKNKSKGIDF